MLRHRLLLASASLALLACDADDTAKQCVASDLIGQCPVGSNPVLGAQASEGCGGTFDGDLVSQSGSVTGQCNSQGSCEFLCQFTVPCSCGVATITKESIVCSECPDQVCGDSRCEGTERAACEASQGAGCFACPEDCAGPSCGDGDCSGSESPDNCPQDCARDCVPNEKECLGSLTRICKADGSGFDTFDCASIGLVCGGGNCVAAGVCGNGVCDGSETPQGCPQDCATACTPNASRCGGTTLFTCSADGASESATDCAASDQICANDECRPADVCGNGLCEQGEDADGCPLDCAAVCGNDVCDNGEDVSCPEDCVVCGDAVCGAGEIEGCPQDCGICVPSEKQCLGTILRLCNANGTAKDDIDCAGFGLVCGGGDCVEADKCGNTLCDGDESADSCPVDCGTVCGDNACEPGESFASCSVDCDPFCGDATCEGLENFADCPTDCLEGCGDRACGGLEDRDNCPSDCGYCGDGTCQDGAETPNLSPPGNLVTCVSDCVVSGCQQDDDCQDGVACTTDRCVQTKCAYTPADDACSGEDKCIRFQGCCADADGDGYAEEACGGSDCNDDDDRTHPGAVEVCGGGDTNCSGGHAPRLVPAKRLTNTASGKRRLKVERMGGEFLVSWAGVPTNESHPEFMTLSEDLVAGAVVTVDEIDLDLFGYAATVWHPGKAAIGMMWLNPRGATGYLESSQAGWVSLDGTVLATSETQGTTGQGFCSGDTGWTPVGLDGFVNGSEVVFTGTAAHYGAGTVPFQAHQARYGWFELGPTGSLGNLWNDGLCGRSPEPAMRLVKLDGIVTGLATNYGQGMPAYGGLVNAEPDSEDFPSVATVQHDSAAGGACTIGEDGDLIVLVCEYQGKVWYHRVTQGGTVFYSAEVQTGAIRPLGIGRANGAAPLVGVATTDEVNNLWFFERSQEGEEVIEPAVIAGGGEVKDAYVLHDGTDFLVVWLAKAGGAEQVFGQRITCE